MHPTDPPESHDSLTETIADYPQTGAGENLSARTVKGVAWTGTFQLVAQPLTFATGIVLARLLSTADFGLVGMAAVALGLVGVVNEFGLAAAVIQRSSLKVDELSSLFWFNMLVGVVMMALTIALAWPVSLYFAEPRLVVILCILSTSFFVGSVTAVHSALLQRGMRFKQIGLYALSGTAVNSAVSVLLAIGGAGVWSLVVPGILAPLIPAILVWRKVAWLPRWRFHPREIRGLVLFGANVTGSSALNYATSNVDNIVVGRALGATSLGLYGLAYNLMLFPWRKISGLVAGVLYPAFSQLQRDNDRLTEAYFRVTRLLAMVTLPLLSTMIVVAPQLITGLYGEKWGGAVLPLQILCVAGMQKAVGTAVGLVMRSKGRPGLELRWNLVSLPVLSAAVLLGIHWGVPGVAVGVVASSLALGCAIQVSALRLIDARLMSFIRTLVPGFVGGTVASAVALGLRYALAQPMASVPPAVYGVVCALAGVGAAVAVVFSFWRKDVREVVQLVRRARRPGRQGAGADGLL
jgi:O-antigen/teichoic acid export membrane protein